MLADSVVVSRLQYDFGTWSEMNVDWNSSSSLCVPCVCDTCTWAWSRMLRLLEVQHGYYCTWVYHHQQEQDRLWIPVYPLTMRYVYGCMDVWMDGWMDVSKYVCMYVCMFVCMHGWMYVCLHTCMYVGTYVRMYVRTRYIYSVYIYIQCVCVCIYIYTWFSTDTVTTNCVWPALFFLSNPLSPSVWLYIQQFSVFLPFPTCFVYVLLIYSLVIQQSHGKWP